MKFVNTRRVVMFRQAPRQRIAITVVEACHHQLQLLACDWQLPLERRMSSVACSRRRDLQVGHVHHRLGHACWRLLAEKMQSSLTRCTRQSRHWSFENRPLHCTHCWWEQIWVESGSPVTIVADLLAWFVAYRGRSLSDEMAN
jgi:hypothetical protein